MEQRLSGILWRHFAKQLIRQQRSIVTTVSRPVVVGSSAVGGAVRTGACRAGLVAGRLDSWQAVCSQSTAAGVRQTTQHDVSALSATTVTRTAVDADRRRLEVYWNDGEMTSYPYIWLRDGCQCSACFHPGAMTRRMLFTDLDLNTMPQNVETNSATQEVIITWSDEHRSVFRYSWLLNRSFRFKEQQARARCNGRTAKLWGSDIVGRVKQIPLEAFLTKDASLYDWLTALEETGFVVLTSVPAIRGQLHRIAARIAYIRKTILGETSFEHTAHETATDSSYLVACQELHNDLIHYYNVPGMKMVHCISQPVASETQVTQFVDGFQAAAQLKARQPEMFRLLSTVKLDFYSASHNSVLMARHPTIKLDDAGDIIQIHYSTRSRDSFSRLPLEEVEPMYRALKTFAGLLYDKENLVEMQLKTGVVYCFNNWRVLHGRQAFRLVAGSEPVFERGYIDWDEMHSRRRVLKSKLGISDEDY